MTGLATIALALVVGQAPPEKRFVSDGLTPTMQSLEPYGWLVRTDARPVALTPISDRLVLAKTSSGIDLYDLVDAKRLARYTMGTSLTGIARRGTRALATDAAGGLHLLSTEDNKLTLIRKIALPKSGTREAYGCGVQFLGDRRALVAMSQSNALGFVDLETGMVETLPVEIAPTALALSADGKTAVVACWSFQPKPGEETAPSAGTEVPVDKRGIARMGALVFVDLESKSVLGRLPIGLQPNDIEVVGDRAYIACANADTVVEVDIPGRKLLRTLTVKPDPGLPFGSAPTSVRADADGKRLLVTCGGNNAIAVLDRASGRIQGWIPTEWYPMDLARVGDRWIVANAKGSGSRRKQADGSFGVYGFTGSLGVFNLKTTPLASTTKTVKRLVLPQAILASRTRSDGKAKPLPVPARLGDPSPIEHVVYVIKENRTYDQVLGDLPRGARDPKLCIFPRKLSPNHHALAEQFVQLDNFYCNGVLSADGHAWSVEGNATSFFERSFGGWTRSYPFGDDPLAPSTTGFIWDNVLGRGKSFRNYGEFDYAEPPQGKTFKQVYDDFAAGRPQTFEQKIGISRLRRYSSRDYPGWNMGIPDVLRAQVFLKELKEFEKKGFFPNFTIVYLPQDHLSGTSPGMPTPRAHMADNDLALGRVVEGISRSKFWPKTAIFVIEDDPQNGFDHIDGHRSLCFVVSPYARRGALVSNFYNQTSVLHTMQRILGLPPMNQMDARSPLMTACFTSKPDFRPYKALPVNVPLDELNPPANTLNETGRKWAELSQTIPPEWSGKRTLEHDKLLNRIIWYAMKGDQPYPEEWEGAHGRGLKGRNLILTGDD